MSERPVIICESLLSAEIWRTTLAQVLLLDFEASILLLRLDLYNLVHTIRYLSRTCCENMQKNIDLLQTPNCLMIFLFNRNNGFHLKLC